MTQWADGPMKIAHVCVDESLFNLFFFKENFKNRMHDFFFEEKGK